MTIGAYYQYEASAPINGLGLTAADAASFAVSSACHTGTYHCPCDDHGKCPGHTKKEGKLYCRPAFGSSRGICRRKKRYTKWYGPFPTVKTKFDGLGEVESEETDLPMTLLALAAVGAIGYMAYRLVK